MGLGRRKASSRSFEKHTSADFIFKTLGAFDSFLVENFISFPNCIIFIIFKIEGVFDDFLFWLKEKQALFNVFLKIWVLNLIQEGSQCVSALEKLIKGRLAGDIIFGSLGAWHAGNRSVLIEHVLNDPVLNIVFDKVFGLVWKVVPKKQLRMEACN